MPVSGRFSKMRSASAKTVRLHSRLARSLPNIAARQSYRPKRTRRSPARRRRPRSASALRNLESGRSPHRATQWPLLFRRDRFRIVRVWSQRNSPRARHTFHRVCRRQLTSRNQEPASRRAHGGSKGGDIDVGRATIELLMDVSSIRPLGQIQSAGIGNVRIFVRNGQQRIARIQT